MKNIITTSIFVFVFIAAQCQIPLEQIKEHYKNYEYFSVIELCEKQLKIDEDASKYAKYLADSYRLTNNHGMSSYWLNQLVEADLAEHEDYLYLALALKTSGEYEEALKWFQYCDENMPENPVVKKHLSNKNYSRDLGNINEGITVQNVVPVNTNSNDFGAVEYKGKLVFSSSRIEGASSKKKYKWDGQNFLDLFSLSKDGTEVSNLSSEVNTSFHEGPICFSSDGKTAYFTRNNYNKGKKGRTEDGTINLKLFSTNYVDGKWTDIKEFRHNSEVYSVGHATLSFDGTVMVFTSDRKDGTGGTDLYMCKKGIYGWDMPINAGIAINTEENEMFPFLHENGTLYFSSNGHLGIGGLDIFKCENFLEGKRIIEHMDAPLNSKMDDFCFYLDKSGEKGFLSSNRAGGAGGDDIYSFTIEEQEERLSIIGQILNKANSQPLGGAQLELWSNNELLETQFMDNNGGFVCRFKAENCPLMIKAFNGDEWSSYEAEVSHCNANQEQIDLGQIFLEKVQTNWQANVNSSYSNVQNSAQPQVMVNQNRTQQQYNQSHLQYNQVSAQPTLTDPVNINGLVTSYGGNQPVGGLLITVTDKVTGQSWQTESPYNGQLDLQLNRGNVYEVSAQKPGFATTTAEINTNTSRNSLELSQVMNTSMMPVGENSTIILENILYDLGKWTIRRDAALELDKLIQTLKDNPTMIIELSSHTDSRGSASDNLKLSEKRAMAAVRYIIDHGISPNRITGKGYGETRLRNNCSDGLKCSETAHQENRRTEVKILSY